MTHDSLVVTRLALLGLATETRSDTYDLQPD